MRHASSLMRTAYRDLFPEDYVATWERIWRRNVARSISRSVHASRQGSLTRRLLARLQLLAAETTHLVRLGDFPGRWSRRKLASWRHRRRAGVATAPDPRFSYPRERRDR